MTSKQRFYVGAVHFLAVESNTNTASPGLADFFQARSLLTSSDWTHYSVFPVASILRLPFLTSHHHISQQSENPNEDGHLVSVCTQNVTYARCAHKQKAFHTCTGTCSWTFTHTFSLSSLSAILAHSVQSSWGGIQTVWHLMWLCVSLWPLSLFHGKQGAKWMSIFIILHLTSSDKVIIFCLVATAPLPWKTSGQVDGFS